MIFNFLKDKAIVILAALLMSSLLTSAVLYVRIYFKDEKIATLSSKITSIEAVSKVKEEEHQKKLKSYDNELQEIGNKYSEMSVEINNFKGDVNETDCESATRLLRGFRYQ